jgi:predicted enzyme related to lactoylglutathione lyase
MDKSKDQHIDYIELPVGKHWAAAKQFYSRAFAWEYQQWGEAYFDTRDSGVGSGLNGEEPTTEAPLVVLYAVDLAAARERVVTAGGKIVREIFEFPGGRRFHFRDPAGNELAVWSDPLKK